MSEFKEQAPKDFSNVLYLVCMESTENNNLHYNQVLPIHHKFPGLQLLFLSPLLITNKQKIGVNRNKSYSDKIDVKEIKLPIPSYMGMLYWFFIPYFLLVGLVPLAWHIRKRKIKIIHCRGYPGMLLTTFVKKLFFSDLKLFFDPRGTYPEEGIIVGRWNERSLSYNLWKRIEKMMVGQAEIVFCVSEGMKDHFDTIALKNTDKCQVAYALVNGAKFIFDEKNRNIRRTENGIEDNDIVCLYVGSIGQWHSQKNLLNIFAQIKKCNKRSERIFLFVLTRQHIDFDSMEDVIVKSVHPNEIPDYMCMSDVGILPGKSEFDFAHQILFKTMISSKVQEYFISGLEIASNVSIHEVNRRIVKTSFGMLYDPDSEKITRLEPKWNINRYAVSNIYIEEFDSKYTLSLYQKAYSDYAN